MSQVSQSWLETCQPGDLCTYESFGKHGSGVAGTGPPASPSFHLYDLGVQEARQLISQPLGAEAGGAKGMALSFCLSLSSSPVVSQAYLLIWATWSFLRLNPTAQRLVERGHNSYCCSQDTEEGKGGYEACQAHHLPSPSRGTSLILLGSQ